MTYRTSVLTIWCHVFAAQVVIVSATLPHDVLEMTSKFMTDPVRVLVKRDELTLEVRGLRIAISSAAPGPRAAGARGRKPTPKLRRR